MSYSLTKTIDHSGEEKARAWLSQVDLGFFESLCHYLEISLGCCLEIERARAWTSLICSYRKMFFRKISGKTRSTACTSNANADVIKSNFLTSSHCVANPKIGNEGWWVQQSRWALKREVNDRRNRESVWLSLSWSEAIIIAILTESFLMMKVRKLTNYWSFHG